MIRETISIEDEIKADRLNLLFEQSRPAVYINLLAGLVYVILLWGHEYQNHSLIWYACLAGSSAYRIVMYYRYAKVKPVGLVVLAWEKPFAYSLWLSSAIWGVGGLILAFGSSVEIQFVLQITLVALAGGAISVYSSIRYLMLVSIFLLVFPLLIFLVVTGNEAQYFGVVACFIFLVSVIRTSKVLADSYYRRFLLGHELAQKREQLVELQILERTRALEVSAELAKKASQAKGEFLAAVNHELRTPLHAMLGTVELLKEEKLPEELRHHVIQLEQIGVHMADLVDNVLDFSKIESGDLEFKSQPFKLEALLEDVENIFSKTAGKKKISLYLVASSLLAENWMGDVKRIRQVLVNLVGNAIKFTESGGITVTVEPDNKKSMLKFVVEDTGQGIGPEDLENLFKPYQQADNQRIDTPTGTGLGLAITKKLVEGMGGAITVESIVNTGTTVTFYLPLTPAKDAVNKEVVKNESPLPLSFDSPLRVLVGEDLTTNQELLRSFLSRLSCEIAFTENGHEAITPI